MNTSGHIELPAAEHIPCVAAAEGIAVGTLRLLRPDLVAGTGELQSHTVEEVRHAIDLTHDQLESFQRRIHSRIEESVAQIFRAHLAILRDKTMIEWIETGVREGRPAAAVIREAYGHHMEVFSRSPVASLREKVVDLEDIAIRLMRNLSGTDRDVDGLRGHIVVATALFPSDLLRLVAQDAAGIVLIGGGATAHISVLARSLQMPLVVCHPSEATRLREGLAVLLDGGQGRLVLNPDPNALPSYGAPSAAKPTVTALLPDTVTADGSRIRLLVNVGLLSEARMARELGADGIGLYRSEIPFLLRDDLPSEGDQIAVYRRLLELAPAGGAVIRLLDLGGDKIASYFPQDLGPNPSLGLRGIRFSLRHPDVFATQVRAILRAGVGCQLRILLPLVSSVDSFRRVRNIIANCAASLRAAGIAHNGAPAVGAMVELPAAVLVAHELAREADFLSIGTNDLVQYILAVDRTDDRVADWYVPWHPAVLRAVKMVADAAISAGRPLSVCGDMACDPVLLPVLIGMGITAFSVPPMSLLRVQRGIADIRHDDAAVLASRILASGSIAEIEEHLGLPAGARRSALPVPGSGRSIAR